MKYKHPPAKRCRLIPEERSVMQTLVRRLSPYGIGRIGGEMARRMVDTVRSFLEEVTSQEIQRSFRQEISRRTKELEQAREHSPHKRSSFPTVEAKPSAGEVHASRYPSGNNNH